MNNHRTTARRCGVACVASIVALTLLVALAGPATAIGPAIDFTTIGPVLNNWSPTNNGFSMGWEFNVLTPVQISRLGYFNYGPQGGGITTPHQVGIFDSSGVLLVSTTVNPGDPVQGWWAWKSLGNPFVLPVGAGYRLAGLTGPVDKYTYRVPSIVVDPSIVYVTNRYIRTPSGQLVNPLLTLTTQPGYHWFGPNMELSPVPEPALLQLPFLLGLSGLAYWRRRKS